MLSLLMYGCRSDWSATPSHCAYKAALPMSANGNAMGKCAEFADIHVRCNCSQVGSHDNPCRIKIIGPTLGFIVGVVAAVICWPLGVILYCCNRCARRWSVSVS